MSGERVQFVTGINYFENLKTRKGENYALTWGIHPEDVAAEKVEVGAAIVVQKALIEKQLDDGKQILFISSPLKSFSTRITSYNAREAGMDSFESFEKEVKALFLLF